MWASYLNCSTWAQQLRSMGLSCSVAGEIVPDQGSNSMSPRIGRLILNHWTTTQVPLVLLMHTK